MRILNGIMSLFKRKVRGMPNLLEYYAKIKWIRHIERMSLEE